MKLAAVLSATIAIACVVSPTDRETIDVLEYVIGDAATWPRHGDPSHFQHQHLETDRVCWTKYTLPWSYECWRWDATYVYHVVDHAIDGRRWEHYMFSDGRWLPRRLVKGQVWSLILLDNRLVWYDADCSPEPARPAPYRVSAWHAGAMEAGGDLGVRDVVILAYQPDPLHHAPNTEEHFYFAKGAGWYRWTRGAAEVTFNRLGGAAPAPTPLCDRDYEGGAF